MNTTIITSAGLERCPETLLADDFSSYAPGIQEIPYYGLRSIGPWETRNIDYIWQLGPGGYDVQSQVWSIEERGGRHLLTHAGENFAAYVCAGDDAWNDYNFEAEFAYEKRAQTFGSSFGCHHDQERMLSGILARYQTQRRHYFWGVDAVGHALLGKRVEETMLTLFCSDQIVSSLEFHRWSLRVSGRRISALLDGKLLALVEDEEFKWGRIGFRTDRPMWIARVHVKAPAGRGVRESIPRRGIGSKIRPPKVVDDLQRKSTWHRIKVADVNRDGSAELLHASLPVLGTASDASPAIELLSLDGQVLWQRGRFPAIPPGQPWRISGTVVHVACLQGERDSTIVLGYRNQIELLDSRTGKTTAWRAFDPFEGVDGIKKAFVISNISDARLLPGDHRQLLVMNGEHLVALDHKLRTLWSHTGNLGHQPCAGDLNGDGVDEVMCGYSMLDNHGHVLWSVPGLETRINSDLIDAHNDHTVFGRFHPDDSLRIAMAASQKGFYLLETDGRVAAREIIGHAQLVVPGNFLPHRNDRQIMTHTLWESAGIFCLFDGRGRLLDRWEFGMFSPIERLRWHGCELDLVLLTDYDRRPAIMDGTGKIVWQAEDDHGGAWRRLPDVGVNLFQTRELPGDAFLANYGDHLVIYGA